MVVPAMSLLWLTITTSSAVMWISNSLPQQSMFCASLSEAIEFSEYPAAAHFQNPRWAQIAVPAFCADAQIVERVAMTVATTKNIFFIINEYWFYIVSL